MNKKFIIIFILGMILTASISVFATTRYQANEIEYNDTPLDEVLDDLYSKASVDRNIYIYLDNELISDVPDKSYGYKLESYGCDDATISYDYEDGTIDIISNTIGYVCNLYFSSETAYTFVLQNLNNDSALETFFSNANNVLEILSLEDGQFENVVPSLLEKQYFRNALYNNYASTQSVIANSSAIKNAMKSSSRYEVISRTGQNKTFYSGKAYVLGFSCQGSSNGNYKIGSFLTSSNDVWNPSGYYSTNGLAYSVNKFASSVYVNGTSGVSYEWDRYMYAAVFKI